MEWNSEDEAPKIRFKRQQIMRQSLNTDIQNHRTQKKGQKKVRKVNGD